MFVSLEFKAIRKFIRFFNRHCSDVNDGFFIDQYMEDLIFEALALTGRAGRGGHEIGIILFLVLGLGIPVPAHQAVDQSFVGVGKFPLDFGGMPVHD